MPEKTVDFTAATTSILTVTTTKSIFSDSISILTKKDQQFHLQK